MPSPDNLPAGHKPAPKEMRQPGCNGGVCYCNKENYCNDKKSVSNFYKTGNFEDDKHWCLEIQENRPVSSWHAAPSLGPEVQRGEAGVINWRFNEEYVQSYITQLLFENNHHPIWMILRHRITEAIHSFVNLILGGQRAVRISSISLI